MTEVKSLWSDKTISKMSVVSMYACIIVIFLIPLLPVIFNRIPNQIIYFIQVYPVILIAEAIISFYILYEKQKILQVCNSGIILRWGLETGQAAVLIQWENIRRISIINSWSLKSFFRWKKICRELSFKQFLKGLTGSRMMIIETHKDRIYFVDLLDWKGFVYSLGAISRTNAVVSDLPVIRY